MFNMSIRLFASITLMSSAALLSACGGGGNKAPATGTLEVVKVGGGTGNVSGGSINCGNACTATGNQGTTITLTATPDNGQTFDGWRNDAASCGAASTCTVTFNSSRFVVGASFSVTPTTTVSVTLGGNSMGRVTSNPAGIDCGTDCSETYLRSVGMVTLTATPANSNNVFAGWSGACSGTQSTCTVMLNTANLSAVATFQPINRSLSVSKTGTGTVTSSPVGINCGSDCGENYQQGSMVTLTATPGSGFSFQGWGGACSGTSTCVLTMDADKTATATFVSTNVVLTIDRLGNGTVTSNPTGINCSSTSNMCAASFARGSNVVLTATAGTTDTFQGWSGGGCTGTGTCTPALTGDVTVTASFSGISGQTPGEFFGLTNNNRVVSFDRTAPGTFRTAASITGLNAGETVVAIDSRPLDGALYGLTNRSRLVTINPVTGAATAKSTLSADPADTTQPVYSTLSGTVFGIDFNPVVDRLRIVSDSGQNLRVNVDTGAVTADTALTPSTTKAVDPAYTFNFNGSTGTGLFVIDSATDKLFLQSPPNDGTLTEVGSLGINADALGGFEIIGSNVDAFAALNVAGGAANGSLYRIDLRNGAAVSLGDFAGNERVISLAAPIAATPPVPGDLALLTTSGKLLTVNRAAPGTLRTSAVITGLNAGDTPLDIDYRPDATRALYLLARDGSTGGSLYIVDPATGAASSRVALAADPADTTDAYAGLTGNVFGIDFNPVADRLRIVSNTGLNLRVNVANGQVTTDTAVAAPSTLLAAAYTNSFLRTGTTTLFTIDGNGRTLNRQDPPNDGTQVVVGTPNLASVSAPVGFDINGSDNEGLLSATSNGTPTLYSLNVSTGAVATTTGETLAGGEAVKGLSLKPTKEPQIFAISSTGNMLRFTTTTSSSYDTVGALTGLPAGISLLGMDFRPRTGELIALGSDAKLYTVNPSTAAATALSTLVADVNDTTDGNPAFAGTMIAAGNQYSVDFNPVVDRLRIVGSNNVNLRVNVDTGAVFTDTTVGRPPFAITGVGFNAAATPVMYGVDSASDRLFTVDTATAAPGTPGRLTQVGELGLDVAEVNGFDVRGTTEAYLVSKEASGAVQLYSVNLTTGKAVVRGNGVPLVTCNNGAAGTDIRGFAASTLTTNLFVIHNGGCLVEFDKDTPTPQVASRAVTGIANTETIIGMDFVAGTNGTSETLYVVTRVNGTDNGKLYPVNTSTGAAGAAVSGGLPPANTFALPAGATSFGVDYNRASSAGAIRITSNTGGNIEVNVSTLALSNLVALNQTTPLVSSEAYTNSFVGAATTRLFALDTGNSSLMTQGKASPNDGQLFDVRALGIAVDNTGSFDILGGADGYAIAILQAPSTTGTNAYSTLYRVDLSGLSAPLALANTTQASSDIGNTATGAAARARVIINAAAVRFTP